MYSGLPDRALTRREREAARLTSCGRTNWQIAAAPVMPEGTTSTHVNYFLRRHGYESRTPMGTRVTRQLQDTSGPAGERILS